MAILKEGLTANKKKVALVVLTLNPGPSFIDWLDSVRTQTLLPDELLVIDSQSTDSFPEKAVGYGFSIYKIQRSEFGHGKTRQLALELLPDSEIVIFMTQDAILENRNSLEHLIKGLEFPEVVAAYGRQLPTKNASPIEAHARIFNYPKRSRIKSLEDVQELGVKTPFFSNSFSAYKTSFLIKVGGFPTHLNFGEDVFVASKLLLRGWRIAYIAEARAFHSHRFSFREEWNRYLQVGQFYGQEEWIIKLFGKTSGEGMNFFLSEIRYVSSRNIFLLPESLIRVFIKFSGYYIGIIQGQNHQISRASSS